MKMKITLWLDHRQMSLVLGSLASKRSIKQSFRKELMQAKAASQKCHDRVTGDIPLLGSG